jgi:hypothetical protein
LASVTWGRASEATASVGAEGGGRLMWVSARGGDKLGFIEISQWHQVSARCFARLRQRGDHGASAT